MLSTRRWAAALVLVATCTVAIGLAACGATADTGGTTISSTSSSVAASSVAASSVAVAATVTSSSLPNPAGSAASPSGVSSSAAGAPSATASRILVPDPTVSRTPGGRLTLTGTVESGVEAGCLVLKDEKTGLRVNITGNNRLVRIGARITVVGQIRTDVMSYCQQGPIFEVITAAAR